MKSIIQWFFIIGSFAFLYWYMPEALKDNKVTLIEMGIIAINALCLLINLSNYIGSKLSGGCVGHGRRRGSGLRPGDLNPNNRSKSTRRR